MKLIDYKSQATQLLNSPNPFAMVVLLQLTAIETRPDDEQRLFSKLEYFRCLTRQGWDIEKSMNLYRFLDTILVLNREYELEYMEKAQIINQESEMELMTGFEKLGFQKGEANLLMNLLNLKFNEIPEAYVTKVNNADTLTLNKWGRNFVFANSLEEVFKD